MDLEFFAVFMEKTRFPQEAREAVFSAWDSLARQGCTPALEKAAADYQSGGYQTGPADAALGDIASRSGVHRYTLWLLTLMAAAQPALERVRQKRLPEALFWETFSDIRYKVLECKEIYNIYGVFVAFWYPIFFTGEILKLGRLEFQEGVFAEPDPVTVAGYTVRPGDRVKQLHIPSSGEPFTRAARLDAYRRACRHFREELNGRPLVCVCSSWLLYPPYQKLLPRESNIAGFAREFVLLRQCASSAFDDGWRVFGPDWEKAPEELPEKTRLQRALKNHLCGGGTTGAGVGLLLFDGERVLTENGLTD